MHKKTVKYLRNCLREQRKEIKDCNRINHKTCADCRTKDTCSMYNIVKDLEPIVSKASVLIGEEEKNKPKQVRNNGW